jgi:hypothetical protein
MNTRKKVETESVLFRVVTQVRKDAEVKPTLYAIAAHDNDPVFPGLHKVIIQNDFPLRM